jgi:PHD/YefM family antitoxin component YafN of YafNO toxin-antitoxin module
MAIRGDKPMKVDELRAHAKRRIDCLSKKQLRSAVDSIAYFEELECREATEELMQIPGLFEESKKAEEEIGRGDVVSWEEISRDVSE